MSDGGTIHPDPRILQANERTLLAWVRTGLTLMAFGFVVARISVWLQLAHPERDNNVAGTWIGILIVALGSACHLIGALRFVRARKAILANHSIESSAAGPVVLALSVCAIGIAALVYLAASAG